MLLDVHRLPQPLKRLHDLAKFISVHAPMFADQNLALEFGHAGLAGTDQTARVIRHRLTEEITRFREDLNGVQLRVKNLKSQVARLRKPDDREPEQVPVEILPNGSGR